MTDWALLDPSTWTWSRPWGFALLAVPLALAALQLGAARGRRSRALAYADAALLPYATRMVRAGARWRGLAADALLWILLACALAGPRQPVSAGPDGRSEAHRVAVMAILDAGRDAADSASGPSPLERARLLLAALWPRLQGERVGLLAYGAGLQASDAGGGGALVQLLPPTRDPALFAHFATLARPALFSPDAVPSLPDALALAQSRLATQSADEPGALLLLAGGDTRWPADVSAEAAGLRLRAAHRPLFVAALPGLDPAQAEALRRLAAASGGRFAAVHSDSSAGSVWDALYARGIATLPAAAAPAGTQWRELFALFLWPALLLALWRSVGPLRRNGASAPALLLVGALAAALTLGVPRTARADSVESRPAARAWAAWTAWTARDYARAESLYAALPGWSGAMGEGDSAYRRGRYQQAAQAFRRALLRADTPAERFAALYNLGDAAMHLPDGSLEAAQAFEAALRIRPDDAAAQRNARLARRQVEVDHPPDYLAGIAKRAPASHHGHFAEQTSETPSQMRKPPPAQASAPLRLERPLGADGRIATAPVPPAQPPAAGWQPPALDWAAADKRLQLLDDATAALWRERAAVDTRDARERAAAAEAPR